MKYLLLILLLINSARSVSQQGQAILGGVVLDQITEDTLYWAQISLYHQDGSRAAFAVTRYPEGQYLINNIGPGVYTLKCTKYGRRYQQKVIRNVILKEGFTNWYPRLEQDTSKHYYLNEDDPFFSDMQWEEERNYPMPSLFPNPAKDYFRIEANELFTRGKIYDINGKMVKEFELNGENRVFVGNLIRGIYICSIEAPRWSYSYPMKFVKL